MKPLTVGEIEKAVRGRLLRGSRETSVTGISNDTRTLRPGSAYFALSGERFDGHDFLGKAMEAGAPLLVVDREPDPASFPQIGASAILRVENVLDALHRLADFYLSQFTLKKVAVTGSTGKTTTKEMLYHILSERFRTVRNLGNYNNLIGLPLSVFTVDETTEAAVFEMGMDRLGEIRTMAAIVRPTVALITNVGHSHLERLGSRERILEAKLEIASCLEPSDTLVVNGDNDLLSKAVYGNYRLLRVGHGPDADARIEREEQLGPAGVAFRLSVRGDAKDYTVPIPGAHNAGNGALAVAAAFCLGVSPAEAAAGLARTAGTDKRLHIVRSEGITVIDDTYNASPDSMRAALDVLADVDADRRIAILGDMFELGPEEEVLHRLVGEYASQKGIDVVLSVGKNARYISDAAGETGTRHMHFDSRELLQDVLDQWIREGDAVLVKGSRGMRMEAIAAYLAEGRK